MSFDEETREIPVDGQDDGSAEVDEPSPDFGPWGADAVALGGDRRNDPPASDDKARTPQLAARRWVVLAALACTVGVIAVLSASALKRDSPTATSEQGTARAGKEAPTARPKVQRAQEAKRAAPQSDQQRLRSQRRARRRPTALPHTTPSAPSAPTPSPTYTPGPEAAPPEPGTPSYAPTPAAPAPAPTGKPPAASGSAVAEEFGFER